MAVGDVLTGCVAVASSFFSILDFLSSQTPAVAEAESPPLGDIIDDEEQMAVGMSTSTLSSFYTGCAAVVSSFFSILDFLSSQTPSPVGALAAAAESPPLLRDIDAIDDEMMGTEFFASSYCRPEVFQQSAGLLFMGGTVLLLTVFFLASVVQGVPLKQLGVRPQGRGLGSFLCNYLLQGTGVWGYDPIQGALSPPLRLLCHVSVVCMIWSVLLLLLLLGNSSGSSFLLQTTGMEQLCRRQVATKVYGVTFPIVVPAVVLYVGMAAMVGYLTMMYVVHCKLPGVSVPSGPLEKQQKIRRLPQWQNKHWKLPALENWKYVHAQDSYTVTHDRFATSGQILTGEACGRDIWMYDDSQQGQSTTKKEKNNNIDEELVQQMALGGRERGFNPHLNPNSTDLVVRAQLIRQYLSKDGRKPPDITTNPKTAQQAVEKAVHFYSMLQTDDGHFTGDYGGPHFLLPGLVIAWYIMGQPAKMLTSHEVRLMIPYIVTHQQTDGGWGTHIESPSTMFGTTMMYVALRLLGVPANDGVLVKGRKFLKDNGGALYTSSWAKFYLCILGCMNWDGHNSVPPEMWLLPNWFPFHPGRMWCHARMVYLPMGYLYGSRFVYSKAEEDPVVQSLREELYCEPYDSIAWIQTRHYVASMDNYSPIPLFMKMANNFLARYETWSIFQPLKKLIRKYGLQFCIEYMAAEDLQTNFIDIGPVNKVLNMLSAFHHADCKLSDPKVISHVMRVADYLWVAEDGMKMKGYNGSQCWDTSFAIQGIFEAGLLDEFPDVSKKVWSFLERTQILSTEVSQATPAYQYESASFRRQFYRHVSEGGWPFSTSAHGWPISDCSGEGLKGVLCLLKSRVVKEGVKTGELRPVSEERLEKAVNVLLSYQNEDGGFATYENNRGFGWYEKLNPSEVFGDIMIDYSYVECSMASLTALADFHEDYPKHRSGEIRHALAKGKEFLKSLQREDGSWYGSWACCFCYGGWFGIEGLVKSGEPKDSDCIKKACDYLLKHQRKNGGWGEDFTSCYNKEYAENGMEAYGDEGSGVVNTAWALLALSAAECPDVGAVQRGVHYLMKRQLPTGDWPQEGIAGVFNRACGITYTAYRNVFPIWAIGRCLATYGATALDESRAYV